MVRSSSSSSSDGSPWKLQPRPAGPTASSGQSSMMEARRRALQQQRREQEAVRHPLPMAGRLGAAPQPKPSAQKSESALPDVFGPSEDEGAPNTTPSSASPTSFSPPPHSSIPAAAAASPSPPPPPPPPPPPTHEATVEELQRQIAAKQKLLQATKERETALREKWRSTKAQKQAEVEQLNGRLRRVWATMEDEKSLSETKLRDAQDAHEVELRAARREVEQAVKSEYDGKITEAQQQMDSAKKEEERLLQLLRDKGGDGEELSKVKNLVDAALTTAVTALLSRLEDAFESEEADGLKMAAWNEELQSLVQHEIRSAFAVGVESEAVSERTEYARFFKDMLAFWRTAEDQERERLLKMDESLMTDLQSMAQQDLRRLQEEALGMERVYVESREQWAMEHQRLLQRELEASLQRREHEMQEQRRQRQQLHQERLRAVEAGHKDLMEREEALHQQQMTQLREYFSREEDLRAERQRVQAAAQEDVTKSMRLLRDLMAVAEEAVEVVKAYEEAVEETRRRVEAQGEESYKEQADLLQQLQALAAQQGSNTDAERSALEESVSQLRLAAQTMGRHLEDEGAWLTQQETAYQRNREEWERSYRRWQHLVQEERRVAEEHFHESLSNLQKSMDLLAIEEHEVSAEMAVMQATFGGIEAVAQKEIEALRQRAADVQSRTSAITDLQIRLSQKKEASAEAKRRLAEAQRRLEEEQVELHADEERLRDMAEALRVAQSQAVLRDYHVELLRSSNASPQHRCEEETVRNTHRYATSDRGELHDLVQPVSPGRGKGERRGATAAEAHKRRHRSDAHRLPNKVLQELHHQLQGIVSAGAKKDERSTFVPTMQWLDLARPRTAPMPQEQRARSQHKRGTSPAGGSMPRDLPAPLAARPILHQKRQLRREGGEPSPPIPSPGQSLQHPRQRHADPSSLPPTSTNSSMRGDADWSPSGNTFTNLLDFSDLETTSQSFV